MKNLAYYLNLDYEIVIKKVSAIEAIESAQNAFAAFVEVSLAQGDSIHEPHGIEKSLRINISMPENLVKKIDSYIQPLHLSRSAFLQKAALREIGY